MDMTTILFRFNGRLRRLPFLGYSILMGLIVGTFIGVAMVTFNGVGIFIATAAAIVLGMWSSVALLVKRLHDIGLSGKHALWIYGFGFVVGLIPEGFEVVALIGLILSFLVSLWLFLMPGQADANRFGPGLRAYAR